MSMSFMHAILNEKASYTNKSYRLDFRTQQTPRTMQRRRTTWYSALSLHTRLKQPVVDSLKDLNLTERLSSHLCRCETCLFDVCDYSLNVVQIALA